MKKALIFLLSLAVVGAVFAADGPTLTFSGSLQTGLVYQMGDNYEDPAMFAWADDAGKEAYRLRLAGDAVNANTGAKFRLSSTGSGDTANFVGVDYAWTYVNLMDSMIHMDVGYKVDDNAWRTKGDDEIDFDADYGVKVQIKPIEGLNLGFTVGMPGKAPVTADEEEGIDGIAAVNIGDLTYIAGFAYAMAPFGFQGGLKADAGELKGAYVGFDYTDVIPGLNLYVESDFQGLNEFSDAGIIKLSEKVKYVTGPIEAALVGTEWLYQNSDVDMGLKVKGSVSYAAGNLKPAIEVVYNNCEADIGTSLKDPAEAEYSTITVKPTLEVKFTDKTKVVSGYEYVALTDMAADNTQKIFVNFRYDF